MSSLTFYAPRAAFHVSLASKSTWLSLGCPGLPQCLPTTALPASSLISPLRLQTQPPNILSVQSLSRVWLFASPRTGARQASLSITNSQSLPKLMSIESVMPSNHLILCRPLLLLPSIFLSIKVFSNESVLCIRVAKVLEFQLQRQTFQWIFRVDFFRMDWLFITSCCPPGGSRECEAPISSKQKASEFWGCFLKNQIRLSYGRTDFVFCLFKALPKAHCVDHLSP